MKFCVLTVLLGAAGLSSTLTAGVLFYPTAARAPSNQFAKATWTLADPIARAKYADGVRFSTGKGGPFSADEDWWRVLSDKPQPGYWHCNVKILPGRKYLAGCWTRFPNAKILLFFGGREAVSGREWQDRLYYFAGFNAQLKPYFNERLIARLSDDPEKWKCLYYTFTCPNKLVNDAARVELGLYLAAGDMTFSEPFLVDVTDLPPTLEVVIAESRPVVALTVSETDTRDVRWTKKFDKPVMSWKGTLPSSCDAFHGQDRSRPKGHALRVDYADGTSEVVYAPLDNEFTNH